MKNQTPASENPNFSEKEMFFLRDREFLLSKIEINHKLEQLFAEVENNLYSITPKYPWPTGVLVRSGKLSKGENYQGLPYYILDYPRKFEKEHVFAFRTMFWWGNFFSATLHLAGKYLDMGKNALDSNLEHLSTSDAYICVNDTPWEYHFQPDNYQKLNELNMDQLRATLHSRPFLKLSQRWELERYLELPVLVPAAFEELLSWLMKLE